MYLYCSSAAERILGYSSDELVGQKHFYDLFAPEVREDLKEAAMAAFSRREPIRNLVNPNVHKQTGASLFFRPAVHRLRMNKEISWVTVERIQTLLNERRPRRSLVRLKSD